MSGAPIIFTKQAGPDSNDLTIKIILTFNAFSIIMVKAAVFETLSTPAPNPIMILVMPPSPKIQPQEPRPQTGCYAFFALV